MPMCPYCGESFKRGKLACPHCGSDAETGWKEQETLEGVDIPEAMDDEDYAGFLADEGLAPRPRAENAPPWAVLVVILLVLSLSGLIWILF